MASALRFVSSPAAKATSPATMLLFRSGKSPPHGRFGRARPASGVSTPLPSRTGRRSERGFRGHVGGVLSSLAGLASFLAPVPQCGKDFLRNSTFLRQHGGVKKRLLMVEVYHRRDVQDEVVSSQ